MPKITGAKAVGSRLDKLASRQKVELVGRSLVNGGQKIRAEASKLITQGAVSGRNHVPSAPGEPPNEDTGFLRSNIEVTQTAPLRVEVSSNAPYSAALEYGTSKMAARPFMGPAARNKRKEVTQSVNKAIAFALRK